MRFAQIPAVLALTALTAFSQAPQPQQQPKLPQGVQRITSVEGITEYSLPNGLHVLLFPDESKPKVTVNMTYLVGSRHEGYGETGMAHLLEHLLFKETKAGRDVKKDLSDHGADFNGSTWYDRTNYYETVQATEANLRWALELEAERMTGMRIEKALLDTEMTVVRNEFEIGENNPGRILEQRVLEAAYTFHNYGKSTIGNRSDIEKVPIDRLAAFYQKYYQPDNAVLTVAGKFDEAKTLAWIAEIYAKLPKPSRKLEQTYTEEPTQDGERTVTLRRVGDHQELMAVYHIPAGTHPDIAPLNVLAAVLGASPSGRLYKGLVDNKKAVSAGMGFQELHDPGFIQAEVRLRQDQSLDEARQMMLKIVENVTAEPPTKEEVQRAKDRILKNLDLSLTNSELIGISLSEWAATGDWRMLFLLRDEIRKVTEADVLRVAKAYLKESNRTLGQFVPTKTPDRADIPAAPDTAARLKDYKGGEAISQGELFEPTPGNIESRVTRTKLSNGVKVILLPKKTRGGTVVAQMRFLFGDEKSLFGKATVAQLTSALLMRGTKNKTRQQIQDETDRLKARVGVNGGVNNATAGIETTEANLAGALKLAAELLKEPSFPEAEFETVKGQRIAGIEAGKSDPQNLGFLELSRHLNSEYKRGDVRYVSTPDEQIEDVKKLTIADVRKFYEDYFGGGTGEIVITGQFNKEETQKLLEELFGEWKAKAPYARILNPYRKVAPLERKIETPDKQNALLVGGGLTKITDEDPDYPAMLLADYMLGGSTGARLFKRVRDKEGLSYTVQSHFTAPTRDDGGQFMALALVAPQNAPKAESSLKDELARTVKDGFTTEEVAAAKTAWKQERMVGRSQDQALAGVLMARARYDRTLRYDEDLEAKVEALTAQQISEAIKRRLDLSSMTWIRAGDFKKASVYQP
jgi:zinc protease